MSRGPHWTLEDRPRLQNLIALVLTVLRILINVKMRSKGRVFKASAIVQVIQFDVIFLFALHQNVLLIL